MISYALQTATVLSMNLQMFNASNSAGGVITFILVIVCLLWVAVTNDFVFHPSGTVLSFAKLPVTVGIYSFCFGGHSVFPSIYSSMREPSRFPSLIMLR